jgi:hypothetical protein
LKKARPAAAAMRSRANDFARLAVTYYIYCRIAWILTDDSYSFTLVLLAHVCRMKK